LKKPRARDCREELRRGEAMWGSKEPPKKGIFQMSSRDGKERKSVEVKGLGERKQQRSGYTRRKKKISNLHIKGSEGQSSTMGEAFRRKRYFGKRRPTFGRKEETKKKIGRGPTERNSGTAFKKRKSQKVGPAGGKG